MKTKLDIQTVHQFHQAGLLDAAKEGYLAILEDDPKNADIMLGLGVLCAQQGDFQTAISTFEAALHFQPQNPVLYLNLGNGLKAVGLYSQATQTFNRAIELDPDYAAALNNLGTVYYLQQEYEDAVHYYQIAINKKPDYLEAYYNLALTYAKQNKMSDAVATYEKLITIAPFYTAAFFQLGCLFLEMGQIKNAVNCFHTVERHHPEQFETQTNLATCYLKLGSLNQAKLHYIKALQIVPRDTQILYNLGVINMQQGHIDSAIQNYQQAVRINPNFFAAHNNLGVAFLTKQQSGYALHHFREALRIQPNNEAVRYTVLMLSQDQHLSTASEAYIKNLFDSYADHYEPHLLNTLDYRIPDLLFQSITTIAKPELGKWDILDIGCGTGLCGLRFEPLAKTLVGVDLSEKMLAVAAQKDIYSELIHDDLLKGLAAKTEAYDLILAGDVLVYTGDLQNIFAAAKLALKSQGLFAFNTEITTEKDFIMNPTGRFAHHRKYLEYLAERFEFKIVYYQQVTLRQQNDETVSGHLYVLQNKHD